MKLVKTLIAVLSAFIICLTTASCSNSYKDAFIYIEFESKPQTLDPQLVETIEEITVARSIFDTLLRYDNQGNIVASAAESYTKNGNTYLFELNENAKWTDGTAVTAEDFVYAFQRAVDPKTKAPYANNLFAIKNAKKIDGGKASLTSLGVKAIDSHKLKIELEYDDPDFLKVLTMPITAPCNENFFNESKGKYGRTVENTPSNGSYYVRVWTTETKFLIRLAKNLDFKGPFEANSMRIYYTCSDIDNVKLIQEENTDISFINISQYDEAVNLGSGIFATEDTCYALFINEKLDLQVRKALLKSINNNFDDCKLYNTQQIAKNLFPDVLKLTNVKNVTSYIKQNESEAQNLYGNYVKSTKDNLDLIIKYPEDSSSEQIAKSLAAHWQNKLSCFVNIQSNTVSSVKNSYYASDYDLIIMPITASGGILTSYISELGLSYKSGEELQKALFKNYLCYPLFFSSTNIAAVPTITNIDSSINNGIMDVAFLIKKQ